MPSASERILEHEPGDLTCIVEADLRLSRLQSALSEHGQRFSLDPPGDPTLGECLLENLSGPLAHRFGGMRDLVIGVTVVLADGMRASSGGKVVKNVAGYDLGKLFCGSRGRLGAVERLALRLHPRPEASATLAADADWAALHRSQLAPSAVDVAHGRMYMLFEGSERSVATQVASAQSILTACALVHEPWPELRDLQASLPGRVRWDGQEAPLVRPGRRVAYVVDEVERPWSRLAERVREALCSAS